VLRPKYPIRTARLVIRPFVDRDLEDLFDLYRRPEVTRYLYWQPFSRDDALRNLKKKREQAELREEGSRLVLAVVLPEIDQVIGNIMLRWVSQEHRQGEIGYSLHPDQHGHGFATEAAKVVLDLGFYDLGLHRIVGRCDARNTASARVLERLGMRREAFFVESELFKGEWADEFIYAILEEEWQNRTSS
jgi:RimJ/RimL family protein N-acetyltransferase